MIAGRTRDGSVSWSLVGRTFQPEEPDLSDFPDWDYRTSSSPRRATTTTGVPCASGGGDGGLPRQARGFRALPHGREGRAQVIEPTDDGSAGSRTRPAACERLAVRTRSRGSSSSSTPGWPAPSSSRSREVPGGAPRLLRAPSPSGRALPAGRRPASRIPGAAFPKPFRAAGKPFHRCFVLRLDPAVLARHSRKLPPAIREELDRGVETAAGAPALSLSQETAPEWQTGERTALTR